MKKAGIVFLIFIISITFYLKIDDLTDPVDPNNKEDILIEIKKGASAQKIVDTLFIHNLIKSRLLFRLYINYTKADQKLQAGYYYLSPDKNMFEIIDQLKKGGNALYKITIPEGFTVGEIIKLLVEKSLNSKEDYQQVLTENNFNFDFLPKENINLIYRLEGYLYPDTYQVPLGYDAKETISVFLNSFKENVIDNKVISDVNSEYNLHKLLTIASLIEKEAKYEQEMPIIASVIYNRLKKDMKLQIDATVQYLLTDKKARLLYEDLKIESLYNTYLHQGLPPGPICNPGLKSIKAALNPDQTDYLFYFALENGKHIFTKNYNEHLQRQNEIKNEESSNE